MPGSYWTLDVSSSRKADMIARLRWFHQNKFTLRPHFRSCASAATDS